jgi:hypothetical protein
MVNAPPTQLASTGRFYPNQLVRVIARNVSFVTRPGNSGSAGARLIR